MRHEDHQIIAGVFSDSNARIALVRPRMIVWWVLDIDVDPIGLDQTAAHFCNFNRNLLTAPRRTERPLGGLVLLHIPMGFTFKLTSKGC